MLLAPHRDAFLSCGCGDPVCSRAAAPAGLGVKAERENDTRVKWSKRYFGHRGFNSRTSAGAVQAGDGSPVLPSLPGADRNSPAARRCFADGLVCVLN